MGFLPALLPHIATAPGATYAPPVASGTFLALAAEQGLVLRCGAGVEGAAPSARRPLLWGWSGRCCSPAFAVGLEWTVLLAGLCCVAVSLWGSQDPSLPCMHWPVQAVVHRRQASCTKIFIQHLSTDEKLLQSVMDSLTSHFFGAVPWTHGP